MSEKRVPTTDFEDSVPMYLPEEKPAVLIENSKHEVSVKACPVKNVTVFVDRAEVNRIVEAEIKQGDVEVLVKDLPVLIDKDSVRVTCFGPATIVEVAYQSKAISGKKENADEIEKQNKSEIEQIKSVIKRLEKQKMVLEKKVALLNKEKKLLDDFSACVSANKKDKVGEILEKNSIDNFLNFMTMYKDRHENLTSALLEANQEIEEIDKEIKVHKKNMKKHTPVQEEIKWERNISVLLDASKDGKVTLVVSYVVSNASWTPLYDVRAFNKDSTVQILYFGTIKQNTGEDWEDAKLSLSTAMPSIGGSPPKLTVQNLYIGKPIVGALTRKSKPSKEEIDVFVSTMSANIDRILERPKTFGSGPTSTTEDCYHGSPPLIESQIPTAMANKGMTSATFEIARTATIQSDDVGHKVSIAQLDFKPDFEYISTPKIVSHAFLKVKAKNESAYALLAGDANVFLDNNFLTKSFLPAVSPMEEFEIALGADGAVKVEYKPVRKFQQTSGMLSKWKMYNYHQVIEVKNTKSDSINITVTDQLPRSCNDKIKVTLQDPEIKIPKQSVSNEPSVVKAGNATLHTTDNSIDWLLNIPPNETKKIDLKYQIEHPLDTRITGLP